MNTNWQGIIPTVGIGVPSGVHPVLAQADPVTSFVQGILQNVGGIFPNLVGAILILVAGMFIASIASSATKGLLKRTEIDNKLTNWIVGPQPGAASPKIEEWIATGVSWLVMVFTIVAVLQTLKLDVVSQPLNNFLTQILGFLPKILGGAILIAVAWVLASVVKLVTTRALRILRVDERLNQQVEGSTPSRTTDQFSLSDTVGSALYWFIFLLFLPSILSTLGLEGTLQPVQQLLNNILAILPNILGAATIGATGWLVAQVVRRIVTNLLVAAGADRLGAKFGLQGTTTSQSLSWILGTIVYVMILLPIAIAALNQLQIKAISDPAIAMLDQILSAIPKIFTASLILVIAYVLGQFVSDLVTNILTSIGFNNVFQWLGLPGKKTTTTSFPQLTPENALPGSSPPIGGQETIIQPSGTPTRTPSELVGIIVVIAIMLFATITATDILEIPSLTGIVTGILAISGQILGGLVVFAIGLYLANLAFNLIASSGSRQSKFLGQAARIAIVALVSAMALQQMGIASDIVNLAFGLLLGAIAVAIALAFGLGARDIAAVQLREWLTSFKDNGPNNQ
ncbi:mechanosensitive ion channel [Limnofasciculus baicalensis]|uniref:Mechanosensitive ion channel n=1 Tax=Limnofasciculus baicalensis BBK-W-15 TaxID=2699891 RepID=A0AAE3GR69_9CYAN|nr:mechanosensitive ion channel [Limnofasciculus baicalensis]MCP2728358.1 mechanosensitive ion channel [Limnofasciculus baicalensis BBK-W-15]